MQRPYLPGWLRYFTAAVWIINGLFCKVLNFVPRHQEIVARILSTEHSRFLTILIGLAELGMGAWILSGIRRQVNAVAQIIIVAMMNSLEFFLVPDLLLWGKYNAFYAFLFIVLVYFEAFQLPKKLNQPAPCLPF